MRTATVILLLGFSSLAATAKEPEPRQMPQIAEWKGPFKDTVIVKYADYSDGVACYVYIPKNVASSLNCGGGGCATQFSGDIGSISCVKLLNTGAKKK